MNAVVCLWSTGVRLSSPATMDCPASPRSRDPLTALRLVLRSVEAIGDVRALSVLLGTFAMTGLLLAMAETALARQPAWWGGALAAAALFVAFYGGNAAGILVMDAARDRPVREIVEALRSSLLSAHRLLLALLILLAGYAAAAALLLGLLWLCRADVLGTVAGPLLLERVGVMTGAGYRSEYGVKALAARPERACPARVRLPCAVSRSPPNVGS